MKRETSMFPGAFLGMALIMFTTTPLPSLSYWECFFWPFPWCGVQEDPKILQPDCDFYGPCQES